MTEAKKLERRRRQQATTVASLLRAVDRTLSAAAEVKRQRDKLLRLADKPQDGSDNAK